MKDKIAEILGNEELTSNEEKTEAIAKALATLVIPKDVFNEQGSKLKNTENAYNTLNHEFEEYKKSKMTEDERIAAEKEDMLKQAKDYTIKSNKLDVMRKLEKAGLTEDDYKDSIDLIVSEDSEKSLKLADFLVNSLQAQSEKVKQQTQVELLNDTPKPVVSAESTPVNNVEELNARLKEAIARKDDMAQAVLMRQIQEEQSKVQL